MSADFSPDQKRFLEGFASGLKAVGALSPPAAGRAAPSGPDAIHLEAQDQQEAAGGKLVDQEKWKRNEHPFDAHARMKREAAAGALPKPDDNFRWRFHGLFNVAPAQESFMCRLRIPNGILNAWQMQGVAALADRFGGGYVHVTTRANLQIREIVPENAAALLEGLADLGLTARGAGADNIRNVTGAATAGVDPQELLDTRPLARAMHFHILNDRSLYGLPRKFNIAFDGGGKIATLEETNDIAFQAVQVVEGASVEPGVWLRLGLGGITGHRDFARDCGVVVKPDEAIAVADAILRVYIAHGDRTNRAKARLKYLLDAWGLEKFLSAVEEKLGRPFVRLADSHLVPRPAFDRQAHIGVHKQKQPGRNWIGIVLPVGRLESAQCVGLARIAGDFGDGELRLTVWQNLILSGVEDAAVAAAVTAIRALGLDVDASSVRAGLVACTGAAGCKFAAAHTKETAEEIARHCDGRIALDQPVNIHLTGCHHSCAQHYIGDIGLIAAKVPINDDGDTVEGFHILVGGGFGPDATMAREIYANVRREDCPQTVAGLLDAWRRGRQGQDESFQAFAARVGVDALKALAAG